MVSCHSSLCWWLLPLEFGFYFATMKQVFQETLSYSLRHKRNQDSIEEDQEKIHQIELIPYLSSHQNPPH